MSSTPAKPAANPRTALTYAVASARMNPFLPAVPVSNGIAAENLRGADFVTWIKNPRGLESDRV